MSGFDAASTGYNPDASGPDDGVLRWRGDLDTLTSPAVAGGRLFVGGEDGAYALSTADGSTEWRVLTGGEVASDPAVADGTVYVTESENVLYALAVGDGSERWRREFRVSSSSPTVHDGVVYVGSWEGYVYAFDAASGDRRWRASGPAGEEVDDPPAVADGRVFVGGSALFALDAGTGSEHWHFADAGAVTAGPVVTGDAVVAGFEDHTVRALDAATGGGRWQFEADDSVRSSPAVADGRVVFGSNDHTVRALDAASGDLRWAYETDWLVASAPAVDGDTVYVGDRGSVLHAVALDDGSARWRLTVGDGPSDGLDAPIAVTGGSVYAASVHPTAVGPK
jgi:outer membrane protein assembly factor BamB